ncbi:MAG: lipoate--protein ligase family protein [Candidatus Margulisbacteria bacterium]|nr:lipoate--protein ligase family protein [Candidatus Margulisiibacteriota bacterium]
MITLHDVTLPTPAENLALDEALLNYAEANAGEESLRFWESPTDFIVLGVGNKIAQEINSEACIKHHIPVLKRCSGGGSVVQGPGCLNYSLILSIQNRPQLADITKTTHYILGQLKEALSKHLDGIDIKGQSDLTLYNKKFSGNAQRRKRDYVLFHGTFLIDFDIAKISRYLASPPKQPEYRQNRPHNDFVTNLPITKNIIKQALIEQWHAKQAKTKLPSLTTLLSSKYTDLRPERPFDMIEVI